MKITKTPLQDCYLIEMPIFGDDRGSFMEAFNKTILKEKIGIDFDIKQVNFASSSKNVLRGLHFQDAPYAQTKLVGVTQGSVLDVVVDLRKKSPTYLKHFKTILNSRNNLLLVPQGFGHGYLSLEDQTLFYYFVDSFYSPQHERGILYNDPDLNIDWDSEITPNVSKKDLGHPRLSDVESHF